MIKVIHDPLLPLVTGTGYQFRYGFVFMYLFQDTSSGDLYALLVCFKFCFRIRAQESRKPCCLILVLFQDMNSGSS